MHSLAPGQHTQLVFALASPFHGPLAELAAVDVDSGLRRYPDDVQYVEDDLDFGATHEVDSDGLSIRLISQTDVISVLSATQMRFKSILELQESWT